MAESLPSEIDSGAEQQAVTSESIGESAVKTNDTGFNFKQRFMISTISALLTLIIRLIGVTLRFTVEIEEGGPVRPLQVPAIYCFWHRCIFAGTFFYRNRNVAVITSRSFDGEYIARIIGNLGFQAIRGSSSRGGASALLGLHKVIESGRTVAFTIDGPRGPVYVAKPGPVLLARNTQVPIICFHIALQRAWVLKSWDATMIPKPFSKALLRISSRIPVPAGASDADLEKVHAEMQSSLERVRDYADAYFKK